LEFGSLGKLSVKAVPGTALQGKADVYAALDGDLAGTLDAALVAGLGGKQVSAATPVAGQILVFDGSS
jgi:hypothetical protein